MYTMYIFPLKPVYFLKKYIQALSGIIYDRAFLVKGGRR
jgi:hypothetical protein